MKLFFIFLLSLFITSSTIAGTDVNCEDCKKYRNGKEDGILALAGQMSKTVRATMSAKEIEKLRKARSKGSLERLIAARRGVGTKKDKMAEKALCRSFKGHKGRGKISRRAERKDMLLEEVAIHLDCSEFLAEANSPIAWFIVTG